MHNDYFLQVSYAKQLGSRLERFKQKRDSPFLATARCPICNEGTSKTKTRFNIYEKSGDLNINCFNCGLSTTLVSFLKNHHPQLFDDFKFEKFRNLDAAPIITTQKKILFTSSPSIKYKLDLPLVSDLDSSHPASKYIRDRQLPGYPFYFCSDFYKFSSQFNESFKSSTRQESRIIIPFFDRSGEIFAYQGRDLSGCAKQKYVTVKIREKTPLLFGMQTVSLNSPITLVEGPLDSLFLRNCIASVNASLSATAKWFLTGINKPPELLTLVLDNEPRNAAVVNEYNKAIQSGFKIVIWPKHTEPFKDINAMILGGLDPEKIIKENTFQGLIAEINFKNWKKI